MADENTISLEALKQYAELLAGDAKVNADSFIATLERSNLTMATSTEVTNTLGTSIEKIGEVVKSSSGFIGDMVKDLRSNFSLLGTMISDASEDIAEFGVTAGFALGPMLNLLPRATDAFSVLGKAGNISGSQITAGYADVSPMFEKVIGGLTGSKTAISALSQGFSRLAQSADIGTNIERNLIRLAARAGDLNKLLNEQGVAYRDLQTESSSFATLTYEIAQATGSSVEEVQKYAESLSPIPGSLRRTTLEISGLRRSMSELEAVMKVATAFGMSNAESTQIMNFAYSELNKTGTDAVSILANIAATSQNTVLPLQMVSDYVQKTSGAFKLLGDNSQGAMNVLRAFSPILRESGLGPEGIQEIVQGMASGIERMDIAHKAFISGASGGPGGLAGGFEIDYLLQEGRFDEVMGKTMEAMQRQFGTSPVTLEDAHRTPALAGELLKQVSFLKDVAGIAQNDRQAYRILEAMKEGAPEKLAQIRETAEPTEVLERSINLGNELQERGNSELTKIHNRLGHLADLAAISNAALMRRTIGIKGTDIAGSMKEHAMLVAERGGAIGADRPVTFERALEEQKNAAIDMGETFKESAFSLLKSFGFSEELIEKALTSQEGDGVIGSIKDLGSSILNAAGINVEKPEGAPVPTESGSITEKILNMFNIGGMTKAEPGRVSTEPTNAVKEMFTKFPEMSEGAKPGVLTTAINQIVTGDKTTQDTSLGGRNADPFLGKVDVDIKLTGIDEINKVIEKKISIERSKATQSAFIGRED